MFKYVFIFETGKIYKANEITAADLIKVGEGILDIVRISDMKLLKTTHVDGAWINIPEYI
jgi:hypothetical protein